jgi:GAF domain-containing protein
VEADRLAGIVAELSAGDNGRRSSRRLCELTTDVIGVSGAGVMLMSREVPDGSLCTTNAVSAAIEELQFTLGEGPCVDAHQHDIVVLEPDLADPRVPRWLAFTPKALEAGVRAVFGFPLRVGAARLGALNLYQDRPGPLSDDQHADALVMADLVAQWVLNVQADASAGALAEELERDGDFHSVVHNAAGIVSVQLGVGATEAMIRLRAYAFSNERQLGEVAQDLVARKLRFG